MMKFAAFCAALVVALGPGAVACDAQASPRGRLELVAHTQRVTKSLGDWRGVAMRLMQHPSARDTWFGEALWQRAFNDEGVYASIGERHAFGSRWTSFVSAGGGTGDFLFPDARADVQLGFAWGQGKRLISSVGGTAIDGKRGYSDVAGRLSLTAYLMPGAVLEVGQRFTRSAPGGVRSARTDGALTLGVEGRGYLVVRGSSGGEGYQLVGPSTVIRKFDSREGGIGWRQWFGSRGGFLLQVEQYTNDLYTRSGVSVGGFVDWK
ncbi:MAG: hypothetical protein MNPFHGCM_00170 [Gemmatimonadaceae bacterium]|nr:hypothetical protein [Gemmatimonadaceae bacterium]